MEVIAVEGIGEVVEGDDLAALLADRATLEDGDIVVVAQKIVSKAEGALVAPVPGESRDAARRRVARAEAVRIVADTPWALITETATGLVCANAGIDASNVPGERLTLLPADPDASARSLRSGLHARGVDVAVIVADTFGRPWRLGQTDIAIGVAGLRPIRDERGSRDRDGQVLAVTETALADELAGAADLVRRKADGVPAVVVRGVAYERDEDASARDMVRPADLDLFHHGRGMLLDALVVADGGDPREPVAAHDLEALRRLDPHVAANVEGAATRLHASDEYTTGLLTAALVDRGYRVRAERAEGTVSLLAGR